MNILPVQNSNERMQSFQGYVDKSVVNRVCYIATNQANRLVSSAHKRGERVLEEELIRIKSTAVNVIKLLSDYMGKLHKDTSLAISSKNGEKRLVMQNPVTKRNLDLKEAYLDGHGYYFTIADDICTTVNDAEKNAFAIASTNKDTINNKFFEYALEDLKERAKLTSFISNWLTRIEMNTITKYAEEIEVGFPREIVNAVFVDAQEAAAKIKNKSVERLAEEHEDWSLFTRITEEMYSEIRKMHTKNNI